MSGRKTAASDCNIVHLDDSWKTYVRKERELSKKWSENWGFLPSSTSSFVRILQSQESQPLTSQLSFPNTTSQEIGWRSAHRSHSLEVFGRWGRPKVSILRHLNWPQDAVE